MLQCLIVCNLTSFLNFRFRSDGPHPPFSNILGGLDRTYSSFALKQELVTCTEAAFITLQRTLHRRRKGSKYKRRCVCPQCDVSRYESFPQIVGPPLGMKHHVLLIPKTNILGLVEMKYSKGFRGFFGMAAVHFYQRRSIDSERHDNFDTSCFMVPDFRTLLAARVQVFT